MTLYHLEVPYSDIFEMHFSAVGPKVRSRALDDQNMADWGRWEVNRVALLVHIQLTVTAERRKDSYEFLSRVLLISL